MSVKPQWASRAGGRLATTVTHIHRPYNVSSSVNAIFYIQGHIDKTPINFLLDCGAAMSIVHYQVLPRNCHVTNISMQAVSANGDPLEVMGKVMLAVSLGSFTAKQEFTVVRHLTVDCLLGADFLQTYSAVLDCGNSILQLNSEEEHYTIPITLGKQPLQAKILTAEDITIRSPRDFTIPGRTMQLVTGVLDSSLTDINNVLVEPSKGLPTHLCLARSLSPVRNCTDVMLQLMNISPTPVTVYKGMKLASATPERNVLLVSQDASTADNCNLDDVDLSHLAPSEQTQLKQLLVQFADLFAVGDRPIGQTSVVTHSIPTTGPPIRQPLRRIPEALKSTITKEVTHMLEHNIIRPSSSPWSSPVVMVRKQDGSWRFCVDYRKLNSVTHRDAYPLPRIDSTLDSLAGATYFTTLDLASGYWQVAVDDNDKEKTAFSTLNGHFEFNVMPFGLTNAPATFQRLMACVLAGLTGEECLIYLDDIIVFSSSFEEHLSRLTRVFQALQHAGLQLKPTKCHFACREVKYLGHIVSEKGIKPDPSKVKAVSEYPIPKNVKELKQFLGLSNYYRRFIKNYAHIAEPLHRMQQKDKCPFQWDVTCQQAFDALKHKLTTSPILAYPNFTIPFVVYSDASDTAIGGILGQIQNNQEVVLCYCSRQLSKTERKYSTVEREALAAVSVIKEFYPYLYGFQFKLITDHNPLTSLKALKDPGGRLARWMMYLQQFDFQVEYRAGKNHGNADTMSRIPSSDLAMSVLIAELGGNVTEVQAAQSADPELVPIITALSNSNPPPRNIAPGLKRCFLNNGLLRRTSQGSSTSTSHTQVILPSCLRQSALQQLHDFSGHLGVHKTMDKVKQRFYWPGYESDVTKWVAECCCCQQRKAPQPAQAAPLGTITANHPFEKLSWDIMGPLPVTSQGNKYVLVITDLFTKWIEAFSLKSTDSETLARILIDEVICRYGVPSTLHSDQGANLTSNLISSLCDTLGITQTRTTAYHPQGNAQVERFNRTLEAMLAKIVSENQSD